jgi:hypothetical protein
VIIVSDHGHINQGGHGGQEIITLREPFVMVGKGVIPGDYRDMQMVDVAPTMAILLGTSIPASNQGRPLIEMLNLPLSQVDNIKEVLSKQQENLAIAYGSAIGVPVIIGQNDNITYATQAGIDAARNARLNNERTIRVIIGIMFFVAIINLVLWSSRPYTAQFIIGIILYLVIFNLKFLLIDQKTYSLSSVVGANDLILSTAISTGIAYLVSWLFIQISTKAHRYNSKQAADLLMRFLLITIGILIIPIIVNFGANGVLVTWALPNFLLSFLALIFIIQVLVVSAIGLLLVGITAFVSLFTNKKIYYQER